jgi:hydrogenase/urease accessory protein HupE
MKALLVLLIAILSTAGFAHDLDLTSIKVVRTKGTATLEVTTPLSRFIKTRHLGPNPSPTDLDIAVRERIALPAGARAEIELDTKADMLHWTASMSPTSAVNPQRFDESTAAARTLFSVYEDGRLKSESILEAPQSTPSFWAMVVTGLEHILSGLDHILFIVGLALLKGDWKSKIKLLTAFTLAHSTSLALSYFNVIHLSPRIVEPLIALSLVTLAIEGMREKDLDDRIKFTIVFAFGLVHGLGFAGALTGLGVTGSQFISSLIAFNLGIEFGQILVILPCLMLVKAFSLLAKERERTFMLCASAAFGMTGCFWFAERLFS